METVRAVAANANYVNGFDVGSGNVALHAHGQHGLLLYELHCTSEGICQDRT